MISAEIAVLIGTGIGGLISILTTLIQQKNHSNLEYFKAAFEMAEKEYQTALEKSPPGTIIAPLESYVAYYIKYIEVVKSRNFKLSDLEKFRIFHTDLNRIYENELPGRKQLTSDAHKQGYKH